MKFVNNNHNVGNVTINGKKINVSGGNIQVDGNGNVFVDGKLKEKGLSGDVHLIVEGDVGSVESKGSITVNGDVLGDVSSGGSAKVSGNVEGNAKAGGSVKCGNVGGRVSAGGSVKMK